MRRKSSLVVYRMAIIALLSALGVVLMLYVKIPYPFASWCEIEISDLTIIVGYVLTGFPGACSIAFIKTLIHMLTMPTSVGEALYIGDLAAILSSLLYLFGIFISSHLFHLFRKGFKFCLVGYLFIALFVAVIMTLLNFLFITPTYLSLRYTTCFDSAAVKAVEDSLGSMGFPFPYAGIIFAVYIPFNLLKSALILALYEILFNTLFFRLFKNNELFQDITSSKAKTRKQLYRALTKGIDLPSEEKR